MTDSLRRTPLYEEHLEAGAKIVPFAGFEMPIHYRSGITAEHTAVRNSAGLFDVSHMGEFEIRGPDALELVQLVTGNDAATLEVGQAQYSTLLRDDATIVDDLLVYRLADSYLLVVNASNREKDYHWISRFTDRFDAALVDRSDEIALLALQGPMAAALLQPLCDLALDSIRYYRFAQGTVDGRDAIVSRTGYTGEDGFELYLAAGEGAHVWRALLAAGEEGSVTPVGLGARDSLRLEMGYALYGNDIDDTRNPFEAGLGWATKPEKQSIASDSLSRIRSAGPSVRLSGFRLLERAFPRPGYAVLHDGEPIATVTSGTLSPTLGVGIGLAYLPTSLAKAGTPVQVAIRDRPVPAEVVRPPFYTGGSVRR